MAEFVFIKQRKLKNRKSNAPSQSKNIANVITNFRDYVFQNNRVVKTLLLFVCDLLYRGQEKRMRENN